MGRQVPRKKGIETGARQQRGRRETTGADAIRQNSESPAACHCRRGGAASAHNPQGVRPPTEAPPHNFMQLYR
ncbi:MAG: hypothetical protein DBY39_02245 [Clostridiales bacterium]|nr:MAG: hypothetical protein DBY39_02245 [Clostridiales bacterium]